jgi:hypothetical protein
MGGLMWVVEPGRGFALVAVDQDQVAEACARGLLEGGCVTVESCGASVWKVRCPAWETANAA